MQILIRYDDFVTKRYELQTGNAALRFTGEKDFFTIPYSEIKDFCITQYKRGKFYFTVLHSNSMMEGQILESEEIEPFFALLKERLNGVLQIEVRKS